MNVVVVIVLYQNQIQMVVIRFTTTKKWVKMILFDFVYSVLLKKKYFRKRISRSPSNEHHQAISSNGDNHRAE